MKAAQTTSFFLGAGVSADKPTSLPMSSELVHTMSHSICDSTFLLDKERLVFQEQLKTIRLERFFSLLHYILGDEIFLPLDHFEAAPPNDNHMAIAQLAQKNRVASIFTTNFDSAMEKALAQTHVPYRVFSSDEDFLSWDPASTILPVFKLHGAQGSRLGSENNYLILMEDVGKSLSFAKTQVLEHILRKTDAIVLGYGGRDDFDIYPELFNMRTSRKLLWISHRQDMGEFSEIDGTALTSKSNSDHIERLVAKWADRGVLVYQNTRKYLKSFTSLALITEGGFSPKASEIDREPEARNWSKQVEEWARQFQGTAVPYLVKAIIFGSDFANTTLVTDNLSIAEELSTKTGNVRHQIISNTIWGAQLIDQGDCNTALVRMEHAYHLSKQNHWLDLIAATGNELGLVHMEKGEYKQAIKVFRDILEQLVSTKILPVKGAIHHNIGKAFWHLGDAEAAIEAWQEALRVKRELGDVVTSVFTYVALAETCAYIGCIGEAFDYLTEGLIIESKVFVDGASCHHTAMGLLAALVATNTDRDIETRTRDRLVEHGQEHLFDWACGAL